ncbi:hypothetical protein HZH68_003296 [Vespula germanica]|uniref:Uncharacterized protein n=1 Tax=Vespula germanica TaxID=30212 RepID=A0A834U306_VESGE|nr:hypothetical protein HZH68_003296 [Vespula germanica]
MHRMTITMKYFHIVLILLGGTHLLRAEPSASPFIKSVEVMLKLDNDVDGCRSVMNHPARCYPDSFVGHPYHPCRKVARGRWRSACSHALYVRVMFHAM